MNVRKESWSIDASFRISYWMVMKKMYQCFNMRLSVWRGRSWNSRRSWGQAINILVKRFSSGSIINRRGCRKSRTLFFFAHSWPCMDKTEVLTTFGRGKINLTKSCLPNIYFSKRVVKILRLMLVIYYGLSRPYNDKTSGGRIKGSCMQIVWKQQNHLPR